MPEFMISYLDPSLECLSFSAHICKFVSDDLYEIVSRSLFLSQVRDVPTMLCESFAEGCSTDGISVAR